ncbi:MAG TPA: hypothetical protein VF665_11090 [Longimicrobium sp.]|jgi:hypothetical protein|uniref:hypothetical protein n=1 Tax=Longimicrobium sp. TaxID=2029185 RepID=UPI002ED84B00
MSDSRPRGGLRREHPAFFWGTIVLVLLLLSGAGVIASRVPKYQSETEYFNRQLSAAQRATRDSLLANQQRRTALAVAVLRRDMRIRSLQNKKRHLAIILNDSVLELRQGVATLRRVHISVGPDSTVRAPDGRTWRLVRPLGERKVAERETSPVYTVPEWVYVARGEPVPPEAERKVPGGLGAYVLRLDDGTEIYSQPSKGPLAETVKPGAFMTRSRDLAAIFEAVGENTPVYIY